MALWVEKHLNQALLQTWRCPPMEFSKGVFLQKLLVTSLLNLKLNYKIRDKNYTFVHF